ncbi:hypothetical protein [Lactiplantibacillus pentosus]|jgi:hypothetical protein|uniref:hypothetical protein n=1 Tax=Lactiplantibacillus pentosus TaxID=1589 RepID=UPI00259AFC95|nr:hypothetical protein [Lactiplantibacillus pentosus]WFC04410.1 hypothetical protein PGN10_05675 [Lactiplantibacillus pentosus]
MPRKLSEEEVQREIDTVQNGRIKIIGEYKNNVTPVLVKCNVCGIEWMASPKMLRKSPVGVGCYHHINLTEYQVQKRIERATNGKISMIGHYKGAKCKTMMQCNNCGYKWSTEPYVVYMGHCCPDCAGKRHRTTDEVAKLIKDKTKGEYTLDGEYLNSNSKISIHHNIGSCNKTFQMTFHAFYNSGQRCPFERRERFAAKVRKSKQDYLKELSEACCGEYLLIGHYKNASTHAWFRHEECKTEFLAIPTQIVHHATGCPFCNASKGERVVRNYLLQERIPFLEQFRIESCRNERPLPFDFAIFNSHGLQCLIEYQGVQHYQPKFGLKNFENGKKRDQIKLDYCKNHNIELIRIPYERWTVYEQLKSQVSSYLDRKLKMLM